MNHDEQLNSRQNQLADMARNNPDARDELLESLRPLIDDIMTSHVDEKAALSKDKVTELAAQALDNALAQYWNRPDYNLGTYFSYHLRQIMEQSKKAD